MVPEVEDAGCQHQCQGEVGEGRQGVVVADGAVHHLQTASDGLQVFHEAACHEEYGPEQDIGCQQPEEHDHRFTPVVEAIVHCHKEVGQQERQGGEVEQGAYPDEHGGAANL